MERQRIIVVLLILAIVFSLISIIVSIGAMNMRISLPRPTTTNHVIIQKTAAASGEVKLFVEGGR